LVSLSLFEAARAGRMPIAACRRQAAAIGRHRIAGCVVPRATAMLTAVAIETEDGKRIGD
jgi:hypothetical protein